jgi:hypothetical protein
MFRTFLAHPQEAIHKRDLVYCVRVVSWLHQGWSGTGAVPPEDEQVMLETCRGP